MGTVCTNHFELYPLEWQVADGRKYSIHNKIMSSNDDYRLEIEYKAKLSNTNPGGRGLNLSVFEQLSHYNVRLYGRKEDAWELLVNPTGWGFSEWSNIVVI